MPSKKKQNDDGGVPLSPPDPEENRHPGGVAVQVPDAPDTESGSNGQKAATQKEK